jgi:diguanylate cyclase (GGDEF)-like protein
VESENNIYKRLVNIGLALSAEKDVNSLLERILREAKEIAKADAGSIHLRNSDDSLRFVIVLNDSLDLFEGGTSGREVTLQEILLSDANGDPNMSNIASRCAVDVETIFVDDSYTSDEFDFSGVRRFDQITGYNSKSFLAVPLKNFSNECIGVLQLLNALDENGEPIAFPRSDQSVLEALASQASVAIENRRMMDEQKAVQVKLEKDVGKRTEELEHALSKLSEAHIILKELTTIDPVTGIRNRQYFEKVFRQELLRAIRQQSDIALLLLDIDHFKKVNDTYGHLAGDECLAGVAREIDNMLNRPSDVVARYGGEEFVVVLPYFTETNAVQLAEQLREDLERKDFKADGTHIKITVSIGVSSGIPNSLETGREFLAHADKALYRAKESGRNRVVNYTSK